MPAPPDKAALLALRTLDECDAFYKRYVVTTDEQRWAAILYAAATHSVKSYATFGRLFFGSADEASGKTVGMEVTVCFCSRPLDAAGSPQDLVNALADASLEAEMPVPTLFRDEIGTEFPGGGQYRGNNICGDILRRGYKNGARRGRGRSGSSQKFSIYTPFIMTGVGPAVLPKDIRSRCIVITMQPGRPEHYFDVRDAESQARDLGMALGREVRMRADQLKQFRAWTLGIKGLDGRRAEVWESLFAVAIALGGEKWLARCTAAFKALALANSEKPVLTPYQKIVQVVAEELAPQIVLDNFVPGEKLGDLLRALPEYDGLSNAAACKRISDALPCFTDERRLRSGGRLRGYNFSEIQEAWDEMKPDELEDAEIPEEVNPFAVDESIPDDDIPFLEIPGDYPGAGGAGGAGVFANGPHTAPLPGAPQLPADPRPPHGAHARPVPTAPPST
jgi:hypothetical protein